MRTRTVRNGGARGRPFAWIVLAGGLLGGCGLGAGDGSAPLTQFDNFGVIEPGRAYRSAQLDATSLRLVLDHYGIRTIVNLRGAAPGALWYENERRVAAEAGVRLVDIDMSAMRLPDRATLLEIYDTLRTAEEPLLIHCQAGADRTGAVATLWRMIVLGQPRDTAARELTIFRGHFRTVRPEMDQLVRVFEPRREWIEHEYAPPARPRRPAPVTQPMTAPSARP